MVTWNISPAPSQSLAVMIGRMDVEEAALLEKAVDGEAQGVAHPRHRAEGVGARPQVGDLAQKLEGVPLLLERVVSTSALPWTFDARTP